MTANEVKWLMSVGLTVTEIMALSQATPDPTAQPAPDPAPTAQPAQDPEPTAQPEPTMKDVLSELNRMSNMLAMSNIRRDSQPVIPDTTTILNGMFAKPEVK